MNFITKHRHIRSFVLRTGRITPAQREALERLWPQFGLETAEPFSEVDIFGQTADLVLEIGFGNGEALLQLAQRFPDRHFIGIEVHTPGVGRLLKELAAQELTNVRVIKTDAYEAVQDYFPPGTFSVINIWFPDPWHKKRHHKRRLVQTDFLKLLASRLKPGGLLHLATDWEDYAEWMVEHLNEVANLHNTADDVYFSGPTERPTTHFEKRGLKLGHSVYDLIYKKTEAL